MLDLDVIKDLADELRQMQYSVPIGPWQRVTDEAADALEQLQADVLYWCGENTKSLIERDAIRERLRVADVIVNSADRYVNTDSQEIHNLQGLIESYRDATVGKP